MRRTLIYACVFLATIATSVLLLATTVRADNGPHLGDFSPTTDACAGCHRVHRGQADKLLTESSQKALCFSCHGGSTPGADTNVQAGVYAGTGQTEGLRGGGFVTALMDTDYTDSDTAGVIRTTTSQHNIDQVGTIWGNGASGVGKGDVLLQCGSCHNPHGGGGSTGGATYRLLRATPIDSDAAVGVDVPDPAVKKYTLTDENGTWTKSGNQYFGEWYDEAAAISDWCAQCHTRYLETANVNGHQDTGDPIFAYRHTSDKMTDPTGCTSCHFGGYFEGVPPGPFNHMTPACISCHVAHGTSASMAGDGMTTYSQGVEWPGSAAPVDANHNSRLLRLDNRGICVQCHLTP